MSKFPVLTKPFYFTTPALSELQAKPAAELKSVQFSVRNQYGAIEFLSKVDLREMDLDSIVTIEKEFVEVYPNTSPPLGTGLNVPARITLNSLKSSKLSILDQCKSMSAKLLSFNEQSGKTVFLVEHFTRFHFTVDESDESENEQPSVQIPLIVDSDSEQSRRVVDHPVESSSEVEVDRLKPLPLDFRRKFKFTVSPQGLVYLPSVNGGLRGYSLDFDNEQAIKGLDVQMNHIAKGSPEYLGTTRHLEEIWYTMARIYVKDTTYENVSNEAEIWTLINSLFGSCFVDIRDLFLSNTPTKEGVFSDIQIQLMRKKSFLTWIKKWKTDSLPSSDSGLRILHHLTQGNISRAASEALCSNLMYLSTLITLTPTEFTRTELQQQLANWKRARVLETFQPNIQNIYEILAGAFSELPATLNWKQKLSLVLQYKSLSYHTLIQVFNEFFQNYSESCDFSSKFNGKYKDFCYLLMMFYTNPTQYFAADMLNPFTFQSYFSVGNSWMIFFSIFTLFEVSEEYREMSDGRIREVFGQLEFLTEAFAEELVNSGRWQMAAYVLRYCKGRSHLKEKIIARNIHLPGWPIDKSITEQFESDLNSSKALYNRSSFHFPLAFFKYLENNKPIDAADILIHEIAPAMIIKYTGFTLYDKLYTRILQKLESLTSEIIMIEEQIYINYLKVMLLMEQKWKPESYEDLSLMLSKINKLSEEVLRLPKSSFNQKVSMGIMQSCLNQWKLQMVEMEDQFKGMIEMEMLDNITACSLEDLLVCTEWLAERYLKSVARSS